MPIPRRPSTAGIIPIPSISSTSRVHKSTESHHVLLNLGASQQSSVSLPVAATPQQRIVQALVIRLKNKLPCYSGMSMDRLEADGATQQAIEALVDLSRDSLDMIAWALTELLDRLSKQLDSNRHMVLETRQSQLFILKVLAIAMASRWSQNSQDFQSHTPLSSNPVSPAQPNMPKQHRQKAASEYTISSPLIEPQPMDEHCVKYILSVMILFLRHLTPSEVPLILPTRSTDITFRDFETTPTPMIFESEPPGNHDLPEHVLRARSSSTSIRSGKHSINSMIHVAATNTTYEKTHMSLVQTVQSVNSLISDYAGRIIFHISASNWNSVFQRIQNKIRSITNHFDFKDSIDLQLMAHCLLDRKRLVQLLNELSSLMISMSLEAQMAIAIPLRPAIWNWIDVFPSEFNEAIRFRGKTEGAPERVFDLLYSMKISGNEKIFWPILTILNGITSDRLSADFQFAQPSQKSSRKDAKFVDDVLRHANSGSRLSNISMTCAIDTCRAAMYVTPDGDVPLRFITYELANEIKTGVTSRSFRQPFWDSVEDIDVALYASALVTVYRFLPEEHSIPIFQICVDPERSEAVKTTAVRACLTLAQEAQRFPWQRSLKPLHDVMAPRFRGILKAVASRRPELDGYGNAKRPVQHPKAKRVISEFLSDKEILVLGIVSLYRAEKFFFLEDMPAEELQDWLQVCVKIWEAPVDISVKVSISSLLRQYSGKVLTMSPSDPGYGNLVRFIQCSSHLTLLTVSAHLLTSREDPEAERLWVSIAHQLLELYVKKGESEALKNLQNSEMRIPAFALAEIAFLVSLTSADINTSHLAARGLRLLSYAERLPDAPVNHNVTDEDRSKRNPIYEQLGDPSIMLVGRVGHQKRIRKLVRLLSYPSGINVAVWEECYWTWKALGDTIEGLENTEQNRQAFEDARLQWQNLALFLAALGGSCVQPPQDPLVLSNIIPKEYLPDKLRVLQTPIAMVENFISELITHLVIPDVHLRDVARDALGGELSPRLYSRLLRKLDDAMREVEDAAGSELESGERSVLFLDQLIAVLKLLVENSAVGSKDMMSIDISATINSLAHLISRFEGPTSYRLKIRFCQLCDGLCDRADILTLRKDTTTRNSILDLVLDWMEPVFDKEGDLAQICSDLNMSCLRTSVYFLDRLQLRQPNESNAGDDSVHVVSRQFNKYSNAVLQSLDICLVDISGADSASDLGSMQYRLRMSRREAEVKELVITGLSHLVSANSEIGFKQCLPLAYDHDTKKRAIFAHVFARVIGQGTNFDPQELSSTQLHHTRLREIVRGPEMAKDSDLVLALAICEICPANQDDMIVSVLLNIFDTRASLLSFLKAVVTREIQRTSHAASLFRETSTYTRFLSAFAKIHGYNYLRSLIAPLVELMATLPADSSYEVDPNRATKEEIAINQVHVEFVTKRFLDLLQDSLQIVPGMFREICAHIGTNAGKIWPDSKFAAMGAFIFLRFISPAVVSPEIVDVEVPKGEHTIVIRRGLMVMAKIIQSLANNIFFAKEIHMTVLNNFLMGNASSVSIFLTELCKPPTVQTDDDNDQWAGTISDDTDMVVLHRFFDKHADKIGKELLSMSKPTEEEAELVAANGKRAWDGLCALLVDLGPPLEAPRLSTFDSKTHQEYINLMLRYDNTDTEGFQDLFIATSVPAENPAVFVLRLSAIDVETLDVELLMYHILKVITATVHVDRQFDVILDCTSFASMSEVPLQWLKYCAELIPLDIRSRFLTVHILNPNTLTQKYLRRLYNISAGLRFCSHIKAYTSVSRLKENVHFEALSQLVYPASLEEEPHDDFSNVFVKVGIVRAPIVLSIGATHLRITSIKAQMISPGLSCQSTEVIPLTDVSDVYNVSTGVEQNEFIIRRRQGITVYFSSAARENIVKTVRAAKARVKEVQAPLTERFSRFSNVPATLLHIGLLSVDLDDEDLRGAAYDLLGGVCSYLKYDKSPIVARKAGFIPGDPSTFALQLSERLADFAPQLTLDFIHEVSATMTGMEKDAIAQRITCLQYMSPWIRNLGLFCNATSALHDRSGARLRDCIRTMADLSVAFPDITTSVQKHIWGEVGKLDSTIVDIVLHEIIRTAIDEGIGTRRCETVAHIVASLSSINVRGRIYSKLRKALGKIPPNVCNTLYEHSNWSEISTYIRLALVVGTQSVQPSNNQLYVPEIVHLVTLTAAEGPAIVRKSVYGIVMNLLQSLYNSRTDDTFEPELLQIINECTLPDTLRLFGLLRMTSTSEYTNYDPMNDKECLDMQEQLVQMLIRVLDVTAGSRGLLNVWRARWMSLVTATAFQLSPAVQTRSFTALGGLIIQDVDDDFIYQILVALKSALGKASEAHTMSVVSMLRCLCKLVPSMSEGSRFVPLLFWLAVALLQSSYFAFYNEATCLLRVTLERLEEEGMFKDDTVSATLIEARELLYETAYQLDDLLRLSFETNFSFSLAAIIFKGIRHTGLRDTAEGALRSLLSVTARSYDPNSQVGNGSLSTLRPDLLGYFLALIPVSTTSASYRQLLRDCNVDETWLPEAGLLDLNSSNVPRITPEFLGINDSSAALLLATFIGTMVGTAQGDDAETEICYSLLSDLANIYPETVSMIYETIEEKIKDIFSNATNARIIRAVSNVFRVSMQDPSRSQSLHESTTTLGITEDYLPGAGRAHLQALDDLGMQGLANSFQFLPGNRGHATKMIQWIPLLVNSIIQS